MLRTLRCSGRSQFNWASKLCTVHMYANSLWSSRCNGPIAHATEWPRTSTFLLIYWLQMLHNCNPFIQIYQTAHERLQDAVRDLPNEEILILLNPRMELIVTNGVDHRRHNLPQANEVAMIIPDEYNSGPFLVFRCIYLVIRNLAS